MDPRWRQSQWTTKGYWPTRHHQRFHVLLQPIPVLTDRSANDMPLPSEMMDVQLRQDLESAAVAEWFNGYLGIDLHLNKM